MKDKSNSLNPDGKRDYCLSAMRDQSKLPIRNCPKRISPLKSRGKFSSKRRQHQSFIIKMMILGQTNLRRQRQRPLGVAHRQRRLIARFTGRVSQEKRKSSTMIPVRVIMNPNPKSRFRLQLLPAFQPKKPNPKSRFRPQLLPKFQPKRSLRHHPHQQLQTNPEVAVKMAKTMVNHRSQ